MNHSLQSIIVFIVLCPLQLAAQTFDQKKSRESGVEYAVTNMGIFGHDVPAGEGGFFYPRGSGTRYVFGAGLWFGAQKQVGGQAVSLSVISYNPNSGISWFVPGTPGDADASATTIYPSLEYDRTTGRHLQLPSIRSPWPLWLSAARPSAVPMMPGEWVADTAGRRAGPGRPGPAFVGNVTEQFVTQYHDGDTQRYEGQEMPGHPLGMHVRQYVYSWSTGSLVNSVIVSYEVVNTSPDTLRNCVVAAAIDADVGSAVNNDRTTYYFADESLRSAHAWSEAESGSSGTLVVTMLEAPVAAEDGFVDNDLRSQYHYSGVLGSFRNWTLEVDPKTSEERYHFMNSELHDGDNGPGDKRMLLGSTPFSMLPGDTAHFAVSYRVLQDLSFPSGGVVAEIETAARQVIDYYYLGLPSSVHENMTTTESLSVHPNPARGAAVVGFVLERGSPVTLRVVDALGRPALERDLGMRQPGPHNHSLDLSALPSGMYRVELRTGEATSSRPVVVAQ